MSNYELITAENADMLECYGDRLATSYKIAFAGPPWNEVSRCVEVNCGVSFSSIESGCECLSCGSVLVEAYNRDALVGKWRKMIIDDNAVMEVSFKNDDPVRATIARPTDAAELAERKYQSNPAMRLWLADRFSKEFVWIEDTFANRNVVPRGNLRDRGQTLDRVAKFYGELQIVTRTLSPAIVSATLRDAPARTAVYIGTEGVGRSMLGQVTNYPGYQLPSVPDTRTLLTVSSVIKGNV